MRIAALRKDVARFATEMTQRSRINTMENQRNLRKRARRGSNLLGYG